MSARLSPWLAERLKAVEDMAMRKLLGHLLARYALRMTPASIELLRDTIHGSLGVAAVLGAEDPPKRDYLWPQPSSKPPAEDPNVSTSPGFKRPSGFPPKE